MDERGGYGGFDRPIKLAVSGVVPDGNHRVVAGLSLRDRNPELEHRFDDVPVAPLPKNTLVGSALMERCVPIVETAAPLHDEHPTLNRFSHIGFIGDHLYYNTRFTESGPDQGWESFDISDALEWTGREAWAPGNVGWVFSDAKLTTEMCPVCAGGWRIVYFDHADDDVFPTADAARAEGNRRQLPQFGVVPARENCGVCRGSGHCDPFALPSPAGAVDMPTWTAVSA